MQNLREICQKLDLVILDLDGTLYEYPKSCSQSGDDAFARSIMMLKGYDPADKDLFNQIKTVAARAYQEGGDLKKPFLKEPYNLAAKDIHDCYHRELVQDNAMRQLGPPCPKMCHAFFSASQQDSVKFVVLTQGAKEWADYCLGYIGLKPFIPDELIIPYEEYGYLSKRCATFGFKYAVAKASAYYGKNFDYRTTAVVEDSVANLIVPKRMQMTTVHIDYGAPRYERHIDVNLPEARHLLTAIAKTCGVAVVPDTDAAQLACR